MEANKKLLTAKEMRGMIQGQQVSGKFLILDKAYRKTKDGKDMYNLKLGDVTGEMDAVVWENCKLTGSLENGAVIGILGDMSNFAGKMQITAKIIKVLEEDPDAYLRQVENLGELKIHFEQMLNSLQDPYLNLLVEQIFSAEVKGQFFRTPAAKRIHHNYPGGLLEHTNRVADLCLKAADSYPELNRDLLLCGALLHDLGKVFEYQNGITPQYTMEGKLLGHIVMGSEMISKCILDLRTAGIEFPERLEWMIKHMILSHHGSLEFGSPVIPLFPEAFILHMMDNMDAKMFVFNYKISENSGDEEFFTNYDSFFAQQFFTYRYQYTREENDAR